MKQKSKHNYRSFIRNFYLFRFLTDFVFVYAVYIILFRMRGLSVLEISLLMALWCAFVVVLEVPTGAVADKWSRKNMLSLGMLSKALCFVVWYFAKDFWIFALGFLFWAIQETFCSGSLEALLFDTLKKYNKEDNYEKITGQGHFYLRISVGISVFLGGFLASYSLDLTLLLSVLFMLIAIIPTFSFEDVGNKKTSADKVRYFSLIKNAFKECSRNKLLFRLILYSAVATAVVGILDEYEQLYFNWVNLPLAFFGVLIVVRMLFEAIGSKYAYKFNNHFKNSKNIYYLSLISGFLLILAVSYRSLFMLPVFALVFLFGATGEVMVESGLQREIKTDQRATIISINSLVINSSIIILATGFGILSKIGSLTWGFLTFGFILIIFSIYSLIPWRRKKAEIKNN